MAQDHVDEEDYDSEADEDFNPDQVLAANQCPASSDEDDDPTDKSKKRREPDDPTDFDNSGDEATISKARRKKRRGEAKDEDDEGGDGGLVKTRAQRKAEGKEKKPLVQANTSSINVNDLWAQMSAPKAAPTVADMKLETSSSTLGVYVAAPSVNEDSSIRQVHRQVDPASTGQSMITIKRTYEFAGEKMEEEKSIPASSEEAKLFLRDQAQASLPTPAPTTAGLRRPKKRASMFDPANSTVDAVQSKGPKLTTLEKSKLDWASHVDKEGISAELHEQRRAKNNYLSRMDFLNRSDASRTDEAKSSGPK